MASRSTLLRFSGTLGIIAVLIFIGSAFIDPFTDAEVFIAPALQLDPDTFMTDETPVTIPTNSADSKLINFLAHLVVPCIFLLILRAEADLIQEKTPSLAYWQQMIGTAGLFAWITVGIIRVLIFPAILPLDDPDLTFTFLLLSSKFYDGAYLLIAFQALISGFYWTRQRARTPGGFGLTIGITTALIILLGPYKDVTALVTYTYGAPIVWFFVMSAHHLLVADQLERTQPTR